jgi:hypothetical protein
MSQLCVSEPEMAVLTAIRDAARAWSTPEQLSCTLGMPIESVKLLTEDMIDSGLLVPWNKWLTLSLESAESLCVQIEDYGIAGRERWVPINSVGKTPRRGGRGGRGDDDDDQAELEFRLRWLEARDPSPGDYAAAKEYLENLVAEILHRPRKWDNAGLGTPNVILIGPAIVWREAQSPKTCWRCEGRHLAPNEICLCCLRWGMDKYLNIVRRYRPDSKTHGTLQDHDPGRGRHP